jgi:hypothetical protein
MDLVVEWASDDEITVNVVVMDTVSYRSGPILTADWTTT